MYLEDQTVPRRGKSIKDTDISSTVQQKGHWKNKTNDLYLKMMLIIHDTRIIIQHKILSMKHSTGVEAITAKRTLCVSADNDHPTFIWVQV
jgi:hypothetical protein